MSTSGFWKLIKILLSLNSLLTPKLSKRSTNGEFYNEPLRRANKKGLKMIRTSGKKGLKTIITSSEEALEVVRTKVTMRDEKEGFGSPIFIHIHEASFLLVNDYNDPSTT
jgi:hypothetical protein